MGLQSRSILSKVSEIKCVLTYFNPEGVTNSSGFISFRDCLFSTALSVIVAREHFDQVEMYTTSEWKFLFQKLGFPFTGYNTSLDKLSFSKYFWAFSKINTYSLQEQPFIHIDNDVFLYSGLPERFLKKDFWFQHRERFSKPGYWYYLPLLRIFQKAPHQPNIHFIDDYAYNCGICGGKDGKLFREHRELSEEYIFHPNNQEFLFEKFKPMLIHQNLLHEQYFLASQIAYRRVRGRVGVLSDDWKNINRAGFRYTHLWGCSKKAIGVSQKLRERVKQFDEGLYNRILSFDIKGYKYEFLGQNVEKIHPKDV